MPEIKQKIKNRAWELGFSLFGVASAVSLEESERERFEQWLAADKAAAMDYMKRNIEKRFCAAELLNNAQSVICVGLCYGKVKPDKDSQCVISSYACYEDYHSVIKSKLFELAQFIKDICGSGIKFKACVDSVPIAERAYAQKAGLGFIGTNRMLINPDAGSRILLGELITDLPLDCDKPLEGSCGECTRCIDACPTGALSKEGIDCRKCLSYLTIESREPIPQNCREYVSRDIFGCDRCVDACPYNQQPEASPDIKPLIKAGYKKNEIIELNEERFNERFGRTPVTRAGLEKLKSHINN